MCVLFSVRPRLLLRSYCYEHGVGGIFCFCVLEKELAHANAAEALQLLWFQQRLRSVVWAAAEQNARGALHNDFKGREVSQIILGQEHHRTLWNVEEQKKKI